MATSVLAFAFLVIGLHLVSTRLWTGALWGVHSWAFLPVGSCLAALALTVIAASPLALGIGGSARATSSNPGATPKGASSNPESEGGAGRWSRAGFALASLAALLGAGVFWTIRIRHNLLGDGVAIVAHGPWAGSLHELEPLTVMIQARAFDFLRFLSGPGHSEHQMIWSAVAWVSIAAGALFIPVAWGLATEIESASEDDATVAADSHRPTVRRGCVVLLFVILLFQGYIELFCGYVENYAPLLLMNGLVLLTGLRFARGRGSLLVAGITMLLAVALHLSASALIPAWVALALWGVSQGPNRKRAGIDLGLTILFGIALTAVLAHFKSGYLLPRTLWDVTVRAVGQRQEDPTYFLSWRHAGDFLNEQMLIGPLGIFSFLAGIGVLISRGTWRRPELAFAALAGLGYAGACLVAGDSNMGYARNWDLLAPAGVVFTAAGLLLMRPAFQPAGLMLALLPDARLWPRVLVLGAALSLFHTLPWIGLNMSERRSVERFATLPLGGGRTENTIAFWHAEHGNFAEAKRWLKRSLALNPQNSRALDLYGRIAFDENNPRLALQAYLIAVTIRPDKPEYRQQLASAVAASGGPTVGLCQIDTLMVGHRDNGALWLERSMLLRASGRAVESAEAKNRAIQLWPGLATTADTLPLLTSR